MSLNILINTAKEKFKINNEELLEIIELIKGEDEFTEEYLISNKVSKDTAKDLIRLFKDLELIYIRYSYECEKDDESEIAMSLKEECSFCKTILQGADQHIIRELYTLKETLTSEVEVKERLELEEVIDILYLENFNKLKTEINKNKIVPFLGSGLSIPLGLPNWTGLIAEMVSGLTDPSEIEQFNEYLKEGDIFNAIDILQKESLSYRTEDQIKSFINEYITTSFREELEDEYHNINDLLKLESDFYITTNYDNALSHYKKKFSYPFILDDLKELQELYTEKNQRIVHLHGNVEKKDTMVVTKEDYERLYKDDKNKTILGSMLSLKSFLFIGFSFTDKYFNDIYQLLRSQIGGKHYIILADLNKHKAQQLLDKGLIPISINVNKLVTEKSFSNEINNEKTQRFVNSLKIIIKYLLK